MEECRICNKVFQNKYLYQRHVSTKSHNNRANCTAMYVCACGKSFQQRQSLSRHKKNCNVTDQMLQETNQNKLERLEKQNEELQKRVEELLMAQETKNSITQNIETQQNIHIHINAFGQENYDYIDDKTVESCLDKIYKSVPAIIKKLHFDPEHPENHNIKITNRKLPYASVMGENQKWKVVDKKNAIEDMVNNGFNILDEKYPTVKTKMSVKKQNHFEGFHEKFMNEDKELHKQLKTDVELLVLNAE